MVLTEIYEPKFSERSFGFRLGRSCHDAIETVRNDCDSGYFWAVDIDRGYFAVKRQNRKYERGYRDMSFAMS